MRSRCSTATRCGRSRPRTRSPRACPCGGEGRARWRRARSSATGLTGRRPWCRTQPMPSQAPDFDWRRTAAWCLHAQQVFDGHVLRPEQAVTVVHGRIAAVGAVDDPVNQGLPVWRGQGTLAPGLFDIQVNGGAGRMFNNTPDADTLRHIGAALARAGTTAWLPTFITDSAPRMAQAARAIEAVHGSQGVVGVHFEGPHISVQRRGAHLEQHIRPLDDATLDLLARLRAKQIPVLLTLAPEQQARGSIARLCAMGVTVSLGHTAANAAQVHSALAEGASCFTHLFNGMAPMGAREPGVVGAALDSPAWCGVIADGHHVADAVLRVAIRSRPVADRMVLVSDAMATTHGPPQFDLYGETIRVVQGRLVNQAGSLAGAHIDLASSVQGLITRVGIDPAQALRMATHNPAQLMGLAHAVGQLRPAMPARMVLFDADWGLAAQF
ncbi:N-acetylglucosamine-6-phosphate deacetylase [Verminephrobacter aporrectodeae subsp. tuberculatae]|nr:N-acetylglucosamine-6-phosphate deacetylase [Verminephrobacter aporrectodeae subsp. tuberculatae]MCW5289402.1 N-acetylglucosamine-6-phosphate deacetylase [Verminephrobacter aporrectodeae subsp. tuberculatae]